MSFTSLGLSEALSRAVTDAGYVNPTPVQQRAIPAVLQGRDLMVAAQTGTGKTGGFALPVLERLFPNGQPDGRKPGPRQPRVLVLTPTRELAAQVHDSFKLYARDLPMRSACVFGGVGLKPQVTAIARGLDVLVACPGRLLDLAGQGSVDLSAIEILVLDEADRMLDMGFIHDVKRVLALLPKERQNLLFSATFSKDITDLADKLLRNPERIQVTPPNTTVERIEQRVFRIPAAQKRALLAHLITLGAWEQVLVFTRTKHGANRLAEYLNKHGLPAAPIHGNKSQNARTKALADFKDNNIRVLVATDIAARGLDIDQLPHVVNFELPNVEEDYVHRIGRTGRAGRSGEAISLVAPDEEKLLKSIERLTKQAIPEGDMQGFDPTTIPPEKTEAREPRESREPREARGQRQPRPPRKKHPRETREAAVENEAVAAVAAEATEQSTSEQPTSRPPRRGRQPQQVRGKGKPRQERDNSERSQPQATPTPRPDRNRDPEVFLDDEVDNFGNRVDYVSPYQNKNKGRTGGPRRPGQGQPARAHTPGAPAQNRPPRNKQGQGAQPQGAQAPGPNKRRKPGAGGPQRPRQDNRPYVPREPRESRSPLMEERAPSKPQPKIMHKPSRADRLLTPEQLDSLNVRPKTEKPALLTRNRSADADADA
ncbi:ATP-dependent RNA helicase RhlE [Pseudomonas duriflava]|uniref:ATP-dependent RNA helicase RhlE n=1 Tax=Pseudomonas duriflava TaxID=459528 RepID=A0A562QDN2_9PSED|nr:DEAD/DEAH box helicase [Pseudomonas duriflava]TWI54875.1 ATP-dependent RNA helicase RhlE [Pseudomonas duriflava]